MSYTIADAVKYSPETGIFVWKISLGNRIAAGAIAGSLDNSRGYWRIGYRGRKYAAHRLAWFLMTGEWPTKQIDHINLNKSDNRWCNLRLATVSQNQANCRSRGDLPKGVRQHQCGKFEARIGEDGKCYYLGLFRTAEEAASAYEIEAKKRFGEFARTA